jgi:Zn-dependent metalloprotease
VYGTFARETYCRTNPCAGADLAAVGDYVIGNDAGVVGAPRPLAIRWLFDPARDGRSPACYGPALAGLDRHAAAGPANHFFYLLAEGTAAKSFNGITHSSMTCNGTMLNGIGLEKAYAIWHLYKWAYAISNSTYPDARRGTLLAAAEIYGGGSPEVAAVAATWDAVNVH